MLGHIRFGVAEFFLVAVLVVVAFAVNDVILVGVTRGKAATRRHRTICGVLQGVFLVTKILGQGRSNLWCW
jgi:hypothetical protein